MCKTKKDGEGCVWQFKKSAGEGVQEEERRGRVCMEALGVPERVCWRREGRTAGIAHTPFTKIMREGKNPPHPSFSLFPFSYEEAA